MLFREHSIHEHSILFIQPIDREKFFRSSSCKHLSKQQPWDFDMLVRITRQSIIQFGIFFKIWIHENER